MKPIFAIVMVLVAVIAGAGSAFFVVKSTKGVKPAEAATEHQAEGPTIHVPLDERTVNLADSTTTRYLRLTLVVVVTGKAEGEKLPKALEEKKALLLDRMIAVVSKHTFKDLLSTEGKATLKEELLKAFDEALKGTEYQAKEVLFTDFVME